LLKVFEEAKNILPEVIDLRRKIHKRPELGNNLPETTAAVLDSLKELDLEIRLSEDTTSIVATLQGEKKGSEERKRILLRGDMDALPMPEDNDLSYASVYNGKMHACGHDAHTAMLMGAAKLLHSHREEISGTVDFFFQTGEEGYFGAKVVLDEGMFEAPHSPDAVFAMHITPLLETGKFTAKPGPFMAAADFWEVTIRGKGGHASMPHDCLDPIPVACEFAQALNSFVTRRINAFDPVVLSTTKIEAGTTNNVIPEVAIITGTLRSTSEKSRAKAQEGIRRMALKIAEAHEMEADVTISIGYPVTVNDPKFTGFARLTIEEMFGEEAYLPMKSPVMAAEDFSYLLERWPGAMVFLGVKPEDPLLAAPCHSNRMILNEEGMAYGVALHTAIALKWLS